MAAVNVLDSGAENVVGAVPLHVLDVDLQLYCCCARPIQAAPRTGRGAGMYTLPSLRLAQRNARALNSAVKISCTPTNASRPGDGLHAACSQCTTKAESCEALQKGSR